MGQYNSIVTVLYWKQASWEGSPPALSFSATHHFPPVSFTHLFQCRLSFPIILSFIIDWFKNLSNPKELPCPRWVCVHLCMSTGSSQVGLWDPLYYIDISSCRVCSKLRWPCFLGDGHHVVTEALRLMERPYKWWCSAPPSHPPFSSLFTLLTHIQICIHY